VQLEAMACKKPIVCCELNNGVTFVNKHGETGLVVPPRDSIALAQAINSLLQDDALRTDMGNRGYQRVTTEFSQEKMWSYMLDLYHKILKN
jgi:rhamnosyl/mannosyltransferase